MRKIDWRVHRAALSFTAAVITVFASAHLSEAFSPESATKAGQRLPATVAPASYTLYFEPYPERGRFTGSETVQINVSKTTDTVVLNSAELRLSEVTCLPLNAGKGVAPVRARTLYRPETEQVKLEFARELEPGRYNLSLHFDGVLNDKLRGFYRSNFTDASGKKIWMATTQMEPTDARRMFPCFDEPEFKATFSITAEIEPGAVAISNAPIAEEKKDAKTHRTVVRFEESPKMSTYLVALIVGPMRATEPVVVEGVPIRVWSVPGKESMGKNAQDVAAKLLTYYNGYFGVPYPAKKLDLIAIPDFEAGAMENLGAITFRENALLVDEKTATTGHKQDVASVVAHEMAHMWFGDLVTMKWWDDLWLNEAFATWMSFKACDHLYPDWHQWDEFVRGRLEAMTTDCLHSTRPIHFSVSDPAQVNQMFDEITYRKGASVLRMLERYVTEDVFRDGVQRYIKAHQFANATTQDLWSSIADASGKEINEMMHGWVYQPGYPLITVDASDAAKFIAAQERFLLLKRNNESNAAFGTLWQIPLAYRGLKDKAAIARTMFESKQSSIKAAAQEPWVVNAGGDGYYRVRYSPALLHSIDDDLQNNLSAAERISLLSDQFSLAFTGMIPLKDYLALTAKYKDETDANVISLLITEMHSLYEVVDSKSRPAFQAFVRDRLEPAKQRLGWTVADNEDVLTTLARQEVLSAMGTIGQDKETIAQAREQFKKYLADKNSVNKDLIPPILNVVAYNGGEQEYKQITALWQKAQSPELEKRALLALGLFRTPALIERTLQMALTETVRTQDAPNLIGEIVNSVDGRNLGWQFTQTHWHSITERFAPHLVPRIISGASSLNSSDEAEQFRSFFKANPLPFGTRTIAKTTEEIEANAAFRQRSGEALSLWLASNTDTVPEKTTSSMK